MNEDLFKEFIREKVEAALKHMEPLKAPELDGMSPLFFQSFWSVLGDELHVLYCLYIYVKFCAIQILFTT